MDSEAAAAKLGHNIMDHHLGVGASGIVEGYEDKYTLAVVQMEYTYPVTGIYWR